MPKGGRDMESKATGEGVGKADGEKDLHQGGGREGGRGGRQNGKSIDEVSSYDSTSS